MNTHGKMARRAALRSAAMDVTLALAGASLGQAQTTGDPVTLGVSGPLTGQNAHYGAQ
ncbi:hypothetical protein [Lichenifustis flavocetrariae]|uniref:Uncharacterized protein n=1 Tax=Lichenifustis flavocetrariae TaxID=2949735 RepID=A0AA41Z3U7_9HYPH|nr:hypothetical protein [Lichenifustis flavocetrariae]MCW6513209.1 hypothetical protein [Lichenifustis flavocetrariae]